MERDKLTKNYYIQDFYMFYDSVKTPMMNSDVYSKFLYKTDYSFPLVGKLNQTYFPITKSEEVNEDCICLPPEMRNQINDKLPKSKQVFILTENAEHIKKHMGLFL